MRKNYIILILTTVILSCSESELKNGGYFSAQNNDLFYALEINSSLDTINLFILNELSSSDSQEIIDSRKDFKYFRSGLIEIKGDKILITELDSDIMPSKRPDLKDLTFRNGKIYADCKNLSEFFNGELMFPFCDFEKITFSRMKK